MTVRALLKVAIHYALALAAILLMAWAAGAVIEAVGRAGTVATDEEFFDLQTVLDVFEVLLGCAAIVLAWRFMMRRRPGLAALVLLLTVAIPLLAAVNYGSDFGCKSVRWALLPQPLLNWRVRIRKHVAPVLTPTEAPPPRYLRGHLTFVPSETKVPPGFLDQAMTTDIGGYSRCFSEGADDCTAYVLDVYGNGQPSVLTVAQGDQHDDYLSAEVFSRGRNGLWRRTGELTITCAAQMEALKEGKAQFATPRVRDVVLAGRQFSLMVDPTYGCPERGGRVPDLR